LGSRLRFGGGYVTLRPGNFPGLPEGSKDFRNLDGVPEVTEEGPFMARVAAFKFALTSLLLSAAISGPPAQARSLTDRQVERNPAVIRIAELPRQGRDTYELIRQGGPFPNDKDGVVFGNRERMLPAEKRGYYREYTVATPGSRDRGARRIVCGGPARAPHACYYTADHYASFRKIVE
jgi:ribonuclease T1